MDLPLPEELRTASELLRGRYPAPAGNAELTRLAREAAAWIAAVTARDVGVGGGETTFGCTFEPAPTWMEPVAISAVANLVEQAAITRTAKKRTAAISGQRLRSINAGPWGESYFSPEEMSRAHVLHPDPELAAMLWAISTDCARAYWLRAWEDEPPPAAAAMRFDRRRPGQDRWPHY